MLPTQETSDPAAAERLLLLNRSMRRYRLYRSYFRAYDDLTGTMAVPRPTEQQALVNICFPPEVIT